MAKYQSNGPRDDSAIPLTEFKSDWIESAIKAEAIEYAEQLGKKLVFERFTTSQIRNFYGELKRIQLKNIKEEKQKAAFLLLYPKLAYAAKRAGSLGASTFKTEIIKAHKAVRIDEPGSEKRFQNFCDLCEAILAFHKANGGKD